MNKFLLSCLIVCAINIFHNAYSQLPGFELTFGGPGTQICSGVATGSDSSIYLLGTTNSGPLGGADFMLAKVSPTGNLLWTKFLGTSTDDQGVSIIISDNKLYLFGNSTDSLSNNQVIAIITDTAGNQISTESFGTSQSENIHTAKKCPDGGYFMIGFQANGGTNYAYALKVDSLLNFQWSGSYGAGVNDYGTGGFMLDNNNYFIGADRRINTGGGTFDYDNVVIHLDSTGGILWDSTYHADFQNGGQGMIRQSTGDILIFGETEIYQFSPFDFFITGIDTSGLFNWRQNFGGVGTNAMFDLLETPSGDLVGTGYSNSASNGNAPLNLAVIKTDASGNLIWQREYGFQGIDIGYSIIPSPDGGFLVCGRATTTDDEDFYLLKVNNDGLLTGINPSPIITDCTIYPNPASHQITIRNSKEFNKINITNSLGQLVYSTEVVPNNSFTTSCYLPDLSLGIYAVSICLNNQVLETVKLCIK